MFNSKGLFKHKDRFYVFKNSTLREEFINKYYNNSLANHFNVTKTHKLFAHKYYQDENLKKIIEYCQSCNIYQRIKTSRYQSYDELKSLFISIKS